MISPVLNQPALQIRHQGQKTLVIADLHVGWEMALSEKGIHVPSQMPKLLAKLVDLISTCNPERLLILGDIKHTVATAATGEWHDVPELFNKLEAQVRRISIVRGNHDGNLEPLLPKTIEILPSTGVMLGRVGLFHGHQWPSLHLLECKTLVMGHVHPVVTFRDPAGFRITKQVWMKVRCEADELAKILLQRNRVKIGIGPRETLRESCGIEAKTSQLFILPSFNDFLGGRPLNYGRPSSSAKGEKLVGPLLRSGAIDLENSETYLLDGTFLGTLNQLRTMS